MIIKHRNNKDKTRVRRQDLQGRTDLWQTMITQPITCSQCYMNLYLISKASFLTSLVLIAM